MKKWFPLDTKEIMAFLGSIIAMGIVKMPNLKSYFSANSRMFSSTGLRDLFSFQCFLDIYANVYFRDYCISTQSSKAEKISLLVETIMNNSMLYYTPRKEITVDETMIGFQGRSTDIVYMPLKPVKYGFKVFYCVTLRVDML